MKPGLPILVSLATATAALPAQSLGCHDLAGVTAIANELLGAHPIQGRCCVRVDVQSATVYEQAFGSFTLQQQVPIASATKTLSAAVLLSLVDSGLLALDDRVGQDLPEWNVGAKAAITLRMCFTHTSGLPGGDGAIGTNTLTLRQAAAQLANVSLQAVPGTTFDYGGVSMHVAGAVCEVASGSTWAQLFAQRIAAPLQLTGTDYFAFGPTSNPRIAGGARSTLDDYGRFVAMLRARGVWNGVQVLSGASVDTMLTAQTVGIPVVGTPHPDNAPYGIGIWIDRRDVQGRTVLASGVGAFGFAGWVDRGRDSSGVFLVQFANQVTFPYVRRIWNEIAAAVLPAGAQCVGASSPACAPAAWLGTTLPARGGTPDFEVRCDRAPAHAPGVLLLGDPLPGGLPFADLTAFVGPQLAVAASLLADGDGRARVAASLAGVPAGQAFTLQALWLTPHPCAQLALQASHALRVDVLP